MDLWEAIRARHSVRSYTDRRIEGETLDALRREIDACNRESGLNIQLCLNEPDAFSSLIARYGRFRNAQNYVALVGKKGADLEQKCGYYGERIVLKAAQLGLDTCWVGGTYRKGKAAAAVGGGEKLALVISIGYGETHGAPRRTKSIEQLGRADGVMPDWFRRGLEAAQLAPTAMNQQQFRFELHGDRVKAVALPGFYAKVDLGIARYHFEIGAGSEGWRWDE
jgi:nitroreductase